MRSVTRISALVLCLLPHINGVCGDSTSAQAKPDHPTFQDANLELQMPPLRLTRDFSLWSEASQSSHAVGRYHICVLEQHDHAANGTCLLSYSQVTPTLFDWTIDLRTQKDGAIRCRVSCYGP